MTPEAAPPPEPPTRGRRLIGSLLQPSELRQWQAAASVLALLNVALIWILPILPGQDLPQHLAYSRILIDYDRPDLLFRSFYTLPDHVEPYFSVYWFLAALGRITSLMVACRILMSVYVIAVFASFHALVRAVNPTKPTAWTGLLATLLVWSPVAMMGFMSFAMCIPLFLWGCAAFMANDDTPSTRDVCKVLLCSAGMLSIHVVAAGFFLIFVSLYSVLAFVARRRGPLVVVAWVVVVDLATTFIWQRWGGLGLGGAPKFDLGDAVRRAYGLDFVNFLFRFTWRDPAFKLSYWLWTVLGPFRWRGVILVGSAFAACAWIIAASARSVASSTPTAARRTLRRSAIVFAVLTWLVPWGLAVPSEVTFIDFRMMTIAFAILLSLIDPRIFSPQRARMALSGAMFFFVGHFAYHAYGFASESADVLGMEREIPADKIMASLPYHNRSAHFAKQFRMTHFLPMYFTVLGGGVTTQFWAKYTDHLPIDYRPGRRPHHAPDWTPELFSSVHLRSVDYILLQKADENDDPREAVEATRKALSILDESASLVRCAGDWCLYRTNRSAIESGPPE